MTAATLVVLTLERVNELLDAAVAEKGPGHVYRNPFGGGRTNCFYVHETTDGLRPGCLVGHVFAGAGVPLGEVMQGGNGTNVREVVDALTAAGVVKAPPEAVAVLTYVQDDQDAGVPWGEAVTRARNEFGL